MLAAFGVGLTPQTTTGEITGTVTDSTGAMVPGATVKVTAAPVWVEVRVIRSLISYFQ